MHQATIPSIHPRLKRTNGFAEYAAPPPGPECSSIRRAILRAAARHEGNRWAVVCWYETDPIAELQGFTARELVEMGRGVDVLRFLKNLGHPRGQATAEVTATTS